MKHFEPVVKKSASYSILLLKDDSKVVRFRLKPVWIKFLAILFIFFSGASGTAGYAAHYYWKKYQLLQFERAELTQKLGENRRQLGRFAGMEKIKESTMPRSTMTGVAAITGGTEAANGGGADSAQNGAATPPSPGPDRPDTSQTPFPPPGEGAAAPPAPASPTPPPTGSLTPPPASPPTDSPTGSPAGSPVNAANAGTPSPPGQQTGKTPESGEKEHPAFISEVQVRPVGNKSFRLAFGLSNRDPQVRLNGRVHLAVSTKSGDRIEITQTNRDTLRFIINNYKRVATEFALPDPAKAEDVARLHLTVTAENQPPVTYSFPITAAL